jgi:hypothetical protein
MAAGFVAVMVAALVTSNLSGTDHVTHGVPDAAVVDVGDLMPYHAAAVASQPLPDHGRVTMVTSEIAAQSPAGTSQPDSSDFSPAELAVNAATGLD